MNEATSERVAQSFLKYFNEKGVFPPSLNALAQFSGLDSVVLTAGYKDPEAVEKEIWKGFLKNTLDRLLKSPEYADYAGREKLLAFYYTFFEEIASERTYVLTTWKTASFRRYLGPFFDHFRPSFFEYLSGLIRDAEQSGEVPSRPFVPDEMVLEGFWVQFLFVLDFWIKDHSPEFTQTDAAIEKAVNLSFDLIGYTPLDSLLDFGKFLIQQSNS